MPPSTKNIHFMPRYGPLGASSRYRFYQYNDYLVNQGLKTTFTPLIDDLDLGYRYSQGKPQYTSLFYKLSKRAANLILASKDKTYVFEGEAIPYLPPVIEYLLQLRGIRYIVDFDDAIFHYYDKSSNPLIKGLLSNKIASVCRNAWHVIAGNTYLKEYAQSAGAKIVTVLPTVIDLHKYYLREANKSDKFIVGWIGSPGSSRYLQSIRSALANISAHNDTQITLIGSGSDHSLDVKNLNIVEWSEDSEIDQLYRIDVGIMPLPNDDWSKGKCGFKLIQYMGCGKPVIASPIGVNCEIVKHGVNGFLANSNEDWEKYLTLLKTDKNLRTKMGLAGRRTVEERFTLDCTKETMMRILSGSEF